MFSFHRTGWLTRGRTISVGMPWAARHVIQVQSRVSPRGCSKSQDVKPAGSVATVFLVGQPALSAGTRVSPVFGLRFTQYIASCAQMCLLMVKRWLL